MPGLGWSHLPVGDVLSLGVWVLLVLMVVGLAVWFVCTIAENISKMGRRVRRPNHDALLRENERLKGSLAEAREENDYLRKLYRTLPRADDEEQNAA
jgi:hypothetical protein